MYIRKRMLGMMVPLYPNNDESSSLSFLISHFDTWAQNPAPGLFSV